MTLRPTSSTTPRGSAPSSSSPSSGSAPGWRWSAPAPEGPTLLFAEHLEGDQPILIFRVDDLDEATARLEAGGVELEGPFEMPYGHGFQLKLPGPQRVAVYERTRPERGASIVGRRDF